MKKVYVRHQNISAMTTSKNSEASYATLQRMRSSTAGGNELLVISDQLEQELLAMYSQDFGLYVLLSSVAIYTYSLLTKI